MYKPEEKLCDRLDDELGKLIKQLRERDSWASREENLRLDLIKNLTKAGYVEFVGHPNRYHLSVVGESCFYDVPLKRRGALATFRGHRVRIVVVRSGRYDRGLMAGIVD